MKMHNSDINDMIGFLVPLELGARSSRMRTQFVKILAERAKYLEENRIELVTKHAKKNDKNEPIVLEGTNQYDMSDMNAFVKDYSELMLEDLILDNTDERKSMLTSVRDTILNVEMVFKGDDAFLYDKMCDIAETIQY